MSISFDCDDLVAECLDALGDGDSQPAIREVLSRAVADPAVVRRALAPERAGIVPLHVSDELTVAQVVWGPHMRFRPHDHRVWAAIAIYEGAEDNVMYRRTPQGLREAGAGRLVEREVLLLGSEAVHAVTNPRGSFSAAIHVYGGNLLATPRSEWDPATLEERPYDLAAAQAHFEAHNRPLASTGGGSR